MHNSCGEIFSGFCRNQVRISESIRTTYYKKNDFEPHSFSNFLIFSSQEDNDDGREGVVWPRMQVGRRRRGRSH